MWIIDIKVINCIRIEIIFYFYPYNGERRLTPLTLIQRLNVQYIVTPFEMFMENLVNSFKFL